MQNWKNLLIISFVFFNLQISYSCQIFYNTSFSADREYIFYGDIVGYTEKHESENVRNEFYGLKIKVTKLIFGKHKLTELELFPFGVGMACDYWGLSLENLKKKYPLNKKIRASGIQNLIYYDGIEGILKLDHIEYLDLSLIKGDERVDISSYPKIYNKIKKARLKNDFNTVKEYKALVLYNLRVDLSRLFLATNENKKFKIAKGLISSNYGFRIKDFKKNISNKKKLNRLTERIERLEKRNQKEYEKWIKD